mgnify:FL=1
MITMGDIIEALDTDKTKERPTQIIAYGMPASEEEYLKNVKFISGESDGEATYHSTPVYTWKEVSDKKTVLDADYASKDYQRKRVLEYPLLTDQLDQLYHDMTAGKLDATGEWHKTIKTVKDKYPK